MATIRIFGCVWWQSEASGEHLLLGVSGGGACVTRTISNGGSLFRQLCLGFPVL
jgi:hypothetical protein